MLIQNHCFLCWKCLNSSLIAFLKYTINCCTVTLVYCGTLEMNPLSHCLCEPVNHFLCLHLLMLPGLWKPCSTHCFSEITLFGLHSGRTFPRPSGFVFVVVLCVLEPCSHCVPWRASASQCWDDSWTVTPALMSSLSLL